MKKLLPVVVAAGLLAGCGTPRIYSWRQYEDLVYKTYADSGKATPEYQIERMEADYQKIRSSGKQVHPGFHAHLGYLYSQVGKMDEARRELETEKTVFPESTVFIDRLLKNIGGKRP